MKRHTKSGLRGRNVEKKHAPDWTHSDFLPKSLYKFHHDFQELLKTCRRELRFNEIRLNLIMSKVLCWIWGTGGREVAGGGETFSSNHDAAEWSKCYHRSLEQRPGSDPWTAPETTSWWEQLLLTAHAVRTGKEMKGLRLSPSPCCPKLKQHVVFWVWLLLPDKMFLRSDRVAVCVCTSLSCTVQQSSLCPATTLCLPAHQWRTFGLFLRFGYYDAAALNTHSPVSVLHFSWVTTRSETARSGGNLRSAFWETV